MALKATCIDDAVIDNESDSSMPKNFPYEITPVDQKVNEDLLNYFTGEKTTFVQVGPQKWFLPSGYQRDAHIYYNFTVRPDDVFIVTFPRSGTTLIQEMIWLLANDLNFGKAAKIPLIERSPFLESNSLIHKEIIALLLKENEFDSAKRRVVEEIDYPVWKMLTRSTERRFIKTHLPFSLLPPNILETGCKVIYVARNPKDVAVSFYHFSRSWRGLGYVGDFPRYWDYFERNLQYWTPYWEHVKEGWNRRDTTHFLFLFYEDANKNLRATVEKVSAFLGKSYSNEQYHLLEDHLKIENFRKNESVNGGSLKDIGIHLNKEEAFIRNGKAGGWKDYFDSKLNARADKWISENLKDTDIRFPEF